MFAGAAVMKEFPVRKGLVKDLSICPSKHVSMCNMICPLQGSPCQSHPVPPCQMHRWRNCGAKGQFIQSRETHALSNHQCWR